MRLENFCLCLMTFFLDHERGVTKVEWRQVYRSHTVLPWCSVWCRLLWDGIMLIIQPPTSLRLDLTAEERAPSLVANASMKRFGITLTSLTDKKLFQKK
jgi:hypothetical protein